MSLLVVDWWIDFHAETLCESNEVQVLRLTEQMLRAMGVVNA